MLPMIRGLCLLKKFFGLKTNFWAFFYQTKARRRFAGGHWNNASQPEDATGLYLVSGSWHVTSLLSFLVRYQIMMIILSRSCIIDVHPWLYSWGVLQVHTVLFCTV